MTATFMEYFSDLKDPRDDKNKKHSPDARSGSAMENRRLAISEKNFVAQK
jgi:hypothetical protein